MAKFKSLLAVLALVSHSAFATIITLESKDIESNFSNDNLLEAFDSLPAGSAINLDSLSGFRPGNDKINKLTIAWHQSQINIWDMEFNLDAGLGAELYVDGNKLVDRTDDIYWGHGDVFSQSIALDYGSHEIVLVWAERCCNGNNFINLTDMSNGLTEAATIDSISAAAVPEPATFALLGLGFAGMMFSRRRAK